MWVRENLGKSENFVEKPNILFYVLIIGEKYLLDKNSVAHI